MKNILKLFTLITILTVLLTGCYPTGEKKLSPNMKPAAGRVSEKFGLAELNYEIPSDNPKQLPRIKLTLKEVDREKAKNVFLTGKTITSDPEMDYYFETADNCDLYTGSWFMEYKDYNVGGTSKYYGNVGGHYNHFCYSSSDQLKTFSSQDAVERVNKILEDLGVENYGEPVIIPVTPEMANDYYTQHDDSYTPWEEDDELYVLKYNFSFNGTDMMPARFKTLKNADIAEGTYITAYVTKDSIFYVKIHGYNDITELDDIADLKFEAGHSSNLITEQYKKNIASFPTFFTDCRLVYAPYEAVSKDEFIYTPAWCFSGYLMGNDPDDNFKDDFFELYDAETGNRYRSR